MCVSDININFTQGLDVTQVGRNKRIYYVICGDIVLAPPPHNRAFVRLCIMQISAYNLLDPGLAAHHVAQPASPLNHV